MNGPAESPSRCFHCGLPNPPEQAWLAAVDGEERSFCCPGCRHAAIAISEAGLTGYYRLRTAAGPRADRLVDDYSAFDSAAVQASLVARHDDGSSSVELNIGGITCAACAWLIEQRLANLPGVEQVVVNQALRRARVRWLPLQTPLSGLFSTIRELGYEPLPYRRDTQAELIRREHREALSRLGIAGLGMMQVMMYTFALYVDVLREMSEAHRDLMRWSSFLFTTPVVLFSARPFFTASMTFLRTGLATMDLPVAVAIAIAFCASIWATWTGAGEVYYDSVVMFVFFLLLGRYLEQRVRHRLLIGADSKSILPLYCRRVTESRTDDAAPEHIEHIAPGDLRANDLILVRPGEIIPADGSVESGESSIDESAFSGEFMPGRRSVGDQVHAGMVNIESPLRIRVSATGAQSRLAGVLQLLEQASLEKPALALLADRVAGYFSLAVLALAAATACFWIYRDADQALWITLSVLVVSCPCALALATPTALTTATQRVRDLGVLITRGHVLSSLRRITHVIFDKTGTLTEGKLRIAEVIAADPAAVLRLAAALEMESAHPIARAFLQAAAGDVPAWRVTERREFPGSGVSGTVDGMRLRLGSPAFAGADPANPPQPPRPSGQWLLLRADSGLLAWFLVDDTLRDSAAPAVAALRASGLELQLLTGDSSDAGPGVARQLGIGISESGATPERKLEVIRALQRSGARVLMVGDGINDAPVLAAADVSVAMPETSDLTRASADCIMTLGDLRLIPSLLRLSRRTHEVILQNLGWALCYNALALPLAAAGQVPPWLAAIGMSGSSLLVVMNALRLHATKRQTP